MVNIFVLNGEMGGMLCVAAHLRLVMLSILLRLGNVGLAMCSCPWCGTLREYVLD